MGWYRKHPQHPSTTLFYNPPTGAQIIFSELSQALNDFNLRNVGIVSCWACGTQAVSEGFGLSIRRVIRCIKCISTSNKRIATSSDAPCYVSAPVQLPDDPSPPSFD